MNVDLLNRANNYGAAHSRFRQVRYSPYLDHQRQTLIDDPSADAFHSLFTEVEEGDIATLVEMQEGMEARCAHMQGVVNTRRCALTALPWAIEPAKDTDRAGLATVVSDYCQKQLVGLADWDDLLHFLATAIGPNVAVLELVWYHGELVRIVPVPGHRLVQRPWTKTAGLAVITDEYRQGLSVNYAPYKFAVYHPNPNGGYPYRRTLTHASAWPYLVQHFARTDWMSFCELFGTPIRVAQTDEGVSDGDKQVLEDMLDNMGSDVAATVPTGVNLSLLQPQGNGETFQMALDWAEKKLAILWLGQTLTTDIGAVGSRAAAQVHDNVRTDLLMGDLQAEARFIEQQILKPMVRLRWPGLDAPMPRFVRTLKEKIDTDVQRLNMERIRLAIELGLNLERGQVYDLLELRRPVDESDTVGAPPVPAVPAPIGAPQ